VGILKSSVFWDMTPCTPVVLPEYTASHPRSFLTLIETKIVLYTETQYSKPLLIQLWLIQVLDNLNRNVKNEKFCSQLSKGKAIPVRDHEGP
jgi:hypothetical protein